MAPLPSSFSLQVCFPLATSLGCSSVTCLSVCLHGSRLTCCPTSTVSKGIWWIYKVAGLFPATQLAVELFWPQTLCAGVGWVAQSRLVTHPAETVGARAYSTECLWGKWTTPNSTEQSRCVICCENSEASNLCTCVEWALLTRSKVL